MHVDNSSTLESLKRLVSRTTSNRTLQQDLLQEAIIHLWLTETNRPNQTTSWYLQSCKFHIQHYMASGRSIDSAIAEDVTEMKRAISKEYRIVSLRECPLPETMQLCDQPQKAADYWRLNIPLESNHGF